MLAAIRVIAITDVALLGDDPATAIARALEGCPPGSVLVQVRAKHLDGGALLAFARAAGPFVAINDRIDVALAANAAAVHLPEDGVPLAEARSLFAGLIGVSRHTPRDAGAAALAGADLVQLGPIWTTPNKGPALGLDALADARRLIDLAGGPTRLVAVGGIDSPDRARQAIRAGAHAVALVRAAWTGASLRPFVG